MTVNDEAAELLASWEAVKAYSGTSKITMAYVGDELSNALRAALAVPAVQGVTADRVSRNDLADVRALWTERKYSSTRTPTQAAELMASELSKLMARFAPTSPCAAPKAPTPTREELLQRRLTTAEAIISRARECVREEYPRDQIMAVLNNPLPSLASDLWEDGE